MVKDSKVIKAPANFRRWLAMQSEKANLHGTEILDHLARNLTEEPIRIEIMPKRRRRGSRKNIGNFFNADISEFGELIK